MHIDVYSDKNMKSILSTNNLKFMDVIDYPNIEIQRAKVTFISGGSGTGKSTLLKLFNGVLSPSFGTVNYLELPVEDYDAVKLRQEVLLAGQSVFLFNGDISSNYDEYCDYREIPYLAPYEKEKFLKICCLKMPLDTVCQTMSGGERQRVFISICLSLNPKVLMLDEPTAALDDATAVNLIDNIKSYCTDNDITLIVVCHNQSLAEKFADKIIVLEKNHERS